MWQTIPLITTGLGLVAFVIAAIIYYLRSSLQQRANIIKSASRAERLDAIALTAEQFRVDIGGLGIEKQAEIVLEQIGLRRRRDFMAFVVILVAAVLLTIIALVAIVKPTSFSGWPTQAKSELAKNEVTIYGTSVKVSTTSANPGCGARAAQSCALPSHDKGVLVPGSGKGEFVATDAARADWKVVEDGPDRICVEFRVSTNACETPNVLTGRAVVIERY